MTARALFVAGSTGTVGRAFMRLAGARGADVVGHRRPRADRPGDPDDFELADEARLTQALTGRTTVVQLIGTMRRRFGAGDTYETSDIGTTRHLVHAAQRAGTVDHLVLLSSVGAGKPVGSYLRAKHEAERLVTSSGIPWTIFRPSSFDGDGHRPPWGMASLTRLFGMSALRPILVTELASAILHVATTRAPLGEILEGAPLWRVVAAARSDGDAQASEHPG